MDGTCYSTVVLAFLAPSPPMADLWCCPPVPILPDLNQPGTPREHRLNLAPLETTRERLSAPPSS